MFINCSSSAFIIYKGLNLLVLFVSAEVANPRTFSGIQPTGTLHLGSSNIKHYLIISFSGIHPTGTLHLGSSNIKHYLIISFSGIQPTGTLHLAIRI